MVPLPGLTGAADTTELIEVGVEIELQAPGEAVDRDDVVGAPSENSISQTFDIALTSPMQALFALLIV